MIYIDLVILAMIKWGMISDGRQIFRTSTWTNAR